MSAKNHFPAKNRGSLKGAAKATYDGDLTPILVTYSESEHENKRAQGREATVYLLREEARLILGTTMRSAARGGRMVLKENTGKAGGTLYNGPRGGCQILSTEFKRLTPEGQAYCSENKIEGAAGELPAKLVALAAAKKP